jgi:hypothetical protein
MRARLQLRAWEYRQRRGTKGTWFRLRHVLARAREAFAVDDDTMRALHDEGFVRERVGDELEPRRTLVFVPEERALAIAKRRALRVRLSAELLGAPNLVLVPFEERTQG